MSRVLRKIIKKKDNNRTVNQVLRDFFGLSKKEISRLKFVKDGILLNDKKAYVNEMVHEKDVLSISFNEEENIEKDNDIKIDICYEDDDLVIVNKASGVVAHKTHGHLDNDLGSLICRKCGIDKVRVIGRLDKDVTGLIIYAKNQMSAARLSKQRVEGKLCKQYLAIVEGRLLKRSDTLRYGINKVEGSIKKEVDFDRDECITNYRVIVETDKYSLLFVEILTGKSHQIRAGFSALGYPLVGDELYGGTMDRLKRPALHCASLQLYQPFTNELIKRDIPLPKDMLDLIEG